MHTARWDQGNQVNINRSDITITGECDRGIKKHLQKTFALGRVPRKRRLLPLGLITLKHTYRDSERERLCQQVLWKYSARPKLAIQTEALFRRQLSGGNRVLLSKSKGPCKWTPVWKRERIVSNSFRHFKKEAATLKLLAYTSTDPVTSTLGIIGGLHITHTSITLKATATGCDGATTYISSVQEDACAYLLLFGERKQKFNILNHVPSNHDSKQAQQRENTKANTCLFGRRVPAVWLRWHTVGKGSLCWSSWGFFPHSLCSTPGSGPGGLRTQVGCRTACRRAEEWREVMWKWETTWWK